MGYDTTYSSKAVYRLLRNSLNIPTRWPFHWTFATPETLANFPILDATDPVLWPPASTLSPNIYPPHWIKTGFLQSPATTVANSSTKHLLKWIQKRKKQGHKIVYFDEYIHNRDLYVDIFLNVTQTLDGIDAIMLFSKHRKPLLFSRKIRLVREVDYAAVLPHMDVIVHHGGAGIASQSIARGRPGVCIPPARQRPGSLHSTSNMSLQEIWCAQLEAHGTDIMILPDNLLDSLKTDKRNLLTPAVQTVLQSQQMKEAAQKLRDTSRQLTGGVVLAADHMELVLKQKAENMEKRYAAIEKKASPSNNVDVDGDAAAYDDGQAQRADDNHQTTKEEL